MTDWDRVRLPDSASLRDFCAFTGASADYLLLGCGSPFRGQVRTNAKLQADLGEYLRREAGVASVKRYVVDVNAEEVLRHTVAEVRTGFVNLYATLDEVADWIVAYTPKSASKSGRGANRTSANGALGVVKLLMRHGPKAGFRFLTLRPDDRAQNSELSDHPK